MSLNARASQTTGVLFFKKSHDRKKIPTGSHPKSILLKENLSVHQMHCSRDYIRIYNIMQCLYSCPCCVLLTCTDLFHFM